MSELYDLFFVPPKKPEIGEGEKQALAVVDIRNSAGSIVRWHALCNEKQYAYHKANGGRDFGSDKAGSGKSISVADVGAVTVPLHRFAGRDVVDNTEKKRYTDKGPVSTEAVAPLPSAEEK